MILSVQTTLGTLDEARALADALVKARLAACAQIERIESVYRWQGAVERAPEVRLVLKTTQARYGALAAEIEREHPYTLPMILALPCAHVLPAYAAWVEESCTPA